MKTLNLFLLFIATLFVVSCQNSNNNDNDDDDDMTENNMATDDHEMDMEQDAAPVVVQLTAKSGSSLSGTATFTESNGVVQMKATINGLSEGEHAIHIHEKGDCSSADGKSAGGHWNPTNQSHGKWGDSKGYHKGDIGNFEVDANGVGQVDFSTKEWCMGCNDPNKDILGKAVIIHDGTDDFTSQPSGAAGTRVGCGVIQK